MTNLNNAYTFYYNYGDKLFVLLCIRLDIRICNRIRIRPKFFFCICIHIRIRGFYFISIRIRIRIQDKCGRLHISDSMIVEVQKIKKRLISNELHKILFFNLTIAVIFYFTTVHTRNLIPIFRSLLFFKCWINSNSDRDWAIRLAD